MSGPLCAAGGFCAGSELIVEHQRISAAAYTYSAALPAVAATTTSETLNILQTTPELGQQLRENIKTIWQQLDPRSDWVYSTSAIESPIMILTLKPEVVSSRKLGLEEQEFLLQDVVDEVRISHNTAKLLALTHPSIQCLANGVLITRLKALPPNPMTKETGVRPALKVCVTQALSKKEIEKAGIVIRHAITKVMNRKK